MSEGAGVKAAVDQELGLDGAQDGTRGPEGKGPTGGGIKHGPNGASPVDHGAVATQGSDGTSVWERGGTFTQDQVRELTAKLDGSVVRTRFQGGREVSYIEGYHAINEANRIFGFGGWSTEVLETRCAVPGEQGLPNYQGRGAQGYLVAYVARVRVTVHGPNGEAQRHEDVGYGEGIDYANVGQAYESAIKEAVTDAEKRALRHWGNQFGLALYDKGQRDVERAAATPEAPERGNGGTPRRGKARWSGPTGPQIGRLWRIAQDGGYERDAVNATIRTMAPGVGSMTREQYDELCDLMQAHRSLHELAAKYGSEG